MKGKNACIVLVVALLTGFFFHPQGAGSMTLKWASSMPPTTIYSKGSQMWADEVGKRTNGRIKIETFFGGSILRAGEELEGVQKGIVDAASTGHVYHISKLPLHNITFAVPFGPSSVVMLSKILYRMYEIPEFIAEVEQQYNQKLIHPACLMESYDILSKKPIKSLADFKGRKMATIAAHVPMVSATQAVPINMPAPERYMSMQTGVIDSTLWGIVSANSFKLQEVAKNLLLVNFGASYATSTTINMDVWKKISPQDQKIILDVGKEATEWFSKETENAVATVIADWKSKGVEVTTLSEADKNMWAESVKELPIKWAKDLDAKGKAGTKVLKAFMKAAEDYGFKFPYKID
jgi:TRAP-type C4-dicarboxylate transport system substrate-binding protein